MRSSRFLLLAGIVAFSVALMALGCSDDDAPTTTTIVPAEEDNGIESLLGVVSAQVNEYLDTAVMVAESGLKVATYIGAGTGDIGDVFMGTIHPDSTTANDWIVSWATDLQSGLGTLTIVDSLTYVVDGALSVSARDADAMYVKHNYDFLSSDTTISYTNVDNRGFLHITGIDGNTAYVDGVITSVINDKFVSADSTAWNDWTIETTLSAMAVTKTTSAWTSGCPETGSATVLVTYRHARDLDLPITTVWEMTVTFTDGDADVDVAIGNLSASYECSLCTP